jgi:hypothetical protein
MNEIKNNSTIKCNIQILNSLRQTGSCAIYTHKHTHKTGRKNQKYLVTLVNQVLFFDKS